jgi:hypothetical protein
MILADTDVLIDFLAGIEPAASRMSPPPLPPSNY